MTTSQEERYQSAREERRGPTQTRNNEDHEGGLHRSFLEAQHQMQAQINQLQQMMQMFLLKGKVTGFEQTALCQCGQRSF